LLITKLTVGTFTSEFKVKKCHKTVEIEVFLNFFLLMERSGFVRIITDPDPVPKHWFSSSENIKYR
jgi:hypothetical protein